MFVLFLVAMALLLAGIVGYMAWAGHKERLPQNVFYGIRTATTTRDADAWRRAHRASAVYSAGAAVTFVVTAVVLAVVRAGDEESAIVWLVGSAAGLMQLAIATRVAVRAAAAS